MFYVWGPLRAQGRGELFNTGLLLPTFEKGTVCFVSGGPYGPVLKIRSHGSHGRGTKGIWGDQRDVIVSFGPPKSLFCPSNSVYSPPQTIVLSPQIPNHLSSPQNNCSAHSSPFRGLTDQTRIEDEMQIAWNGGHLPL